MNRKIYSRISRNLIGLAALALAACNGTATTGTPTTAEPTIMTVAATTNAPVATEPATAAPTHESSLPTTPAEPSNGVPVTYGPASLVLPTGLAGGIKGANFEAVTASGDMPWWMNSPAHVEIELDGYLLQNKLHKPQIYIFKTQNCIDLQDYAAESRQRLQTILANPDAALTNQELPVAPFFNAMQMFAANTKVLPFQNGRGVRFLTQYAQAYSHVNNHGLIYHFEGLSDDGQYYVIAILPIAAPLLAETDQINAPVPAGGIPLPTDALTNETSAADYYSAIAALLDNTPTSSFAPTLEQLDQLIQSLNISANQ